MFGCFRAYYASSADDGFCVKESFGENGFLKNSVINFDALVMKQLKTGKISISYSLSEYIGAEAFKQSVLRIVVPVFHICKNDWGACFIELSKTGTE